MISDRNLYKSLRYARHIQLADHMPEWAGLLIEDVYRQVAAETYQALSLSSLIVGHQCLIDEEEHQCILIAPIAEPDFILPCHVKDLLQVTDRLCGVTVAAVEYGKRRQVWRLDESGHLIEVHVGGAIDV